MADQGSSQEPRRSQRERKQATHFVSVNSSLLKRKRSDETSDDAAQSELSDPESQADEAEVEDEFDAPRVKTKTPLKTKRRNKEPKEATNSSNVKKPRTTKKITASKPVKATLPKPPKPPKTGGRRGRRPAADAAEFDADQVAKETKISGDNAIFNAIINPTIALQSVAEDFLESLSQNPGPSQAELINCILRACGCNDSVDADEVVDYDGVVDKLDDFTEILKKDDSPIYPLTSKLPVFKKFRTSLSELIARIIASSAEHGSLYNSDLMLTLQAWVVAMSSSQLRSFRHTATVIALEVETALCEVAAAVENEAEIVSRQREGERKRKAAAGRSGNKSKGATPREKELESKAAEVRERRAKLAEFLKEFVDGVFVHRYRDLDPSIRAECVRAMGLWFSKYPAHFLDGAYLRYVGWVLSDAQTPVRLEAVRALALAYDQTAYIGAAALQHFTERFKPRLVEMALGDTELSVRVAVVQVLKAINGHGLLEDEQRERLCLLIFDEEARVRRAVGGFVKGVWEENVSDRMLGKGGDQRERQRAGFKALGMLFVQWGKALNKGDEDEDDDIGEGSSKQTHSRDVASVVGAGQQKGRIALAVEALWDEVEPISVWEDLLEMLLLDHSAAGGDTSSQESLDRDEGVDNAWRLDEAEEAVLLEMLIAVLRKTKADATVGKKGEDESVASDITRALMKALPKLFVKHQTDESRMADVLLIPQLMNMDLYLEMRMMTAYANLWEDITKQFLSHSSPVVLTNAVATIRHLMDATSLSNTNSTKVLELEDELSTSLRDAIAGRDEIEIASFSEDEVIKIGAICARLAALIGIRDMTSWMEEDEGGKQSSAWDIINALAERGRLGYKEEEQMVDRALQVLTLHIIWKARNLTAATGETSADEQRFREKLREQREVLLEKLLEFAIGTQSNTAEGVRRAAFQNLMNLHILFCPSQSATADGSQLPTASLPLSLDDETQYRCAGFIQAEIERYADELEQALPAPERDGDEDEDSNASERENDAPVKAGKSKQSAKKRTEDLRPLPRSQLEKEYIFIGVIATFLRAIRAGVINFRHSAIMLAHYGRLGPAFDLCARVIVDILREEGMYKENGDAVVDVICQALRESFTLLLDGVRHTEDHTVALGKTLRACLIIRGAQLTVVKKLEGKFVVNIHTSLLTWLTKRIAAYETAKNKKGRNKSILFFKALLPLLSTLDNRDALIVKAHYDQVLAQNKIEVPPTAQPWEPCRAYERKLAAVMSKDKASGKRGRGGKGTELVTTDEEGTGADTGDENAAPAPPRPKPRPRRRSARGAGRGTDTEGQPSDGELAPLAVSTPKPRPRPRRAPRRKATSESPVSPLTPSPEPDAMLHEDAPPEEETQDDAQTPRPSRKRRRGDDEETNGSGPGRSPSRLSEVPDEPDVPQPNPSQETQADEIQIKRKRIRH